MHIKRRRRESKVEVIGGESSSIFTEALAECKQVFDENMLIVCEEFKSDLEVKEKTSSIVFERRFFNMIRTIYDHTHYRILHLVLFGSRIQDRIYSRLMGVVMLGLWSHTQGRILHLGLVCVHIDDRKG